ncbi:MAG: nucleoside 2-deoxyribosyltransferase [Bacilli bacterium]|nr:nucleoside 2-deoxyribosyltransferase [Bacilli bacterium]MDD3304569.1 nucleoside 2-deoxyribosyltransferase [Bacilli bacterium]MDD4053815.1 nucleoside 2-deoxyribosyltransferase [Bacilli bacterium]MDD4411318.1 nucleoside 2-deoxyribosyltransferase [Bacilli bacterium]
MRKVYFSGSIRGGRGFVDEYFEIIKFLKNNFVVLTEHIGDKNLNSSGEKNKTDEYIFQRDCSWIDESDFVVAEVTNPSLGVGYEICYAEKLNKPILCLYKNNGNKISAMINGNKYLSVYPYNNIEEAQEIIDKFTNDLS